MEINQKICNPEIYLKYLSMNIYVINQNCIRKKNMINQIKKNSKIHLLQFHLQDSGKDQNFIMFQ